MTPARPAVLAIAVFLAGATNLVAQGSSPGSTGQEKATVHDENWQRCREASAVDARIAGCTAIILAAQDQPADLAIAYHNRGNANRAKQLLDLALQDYGEAITLNPKFADALGDRGITLTAVGRFAEAIPDFSQVIDADPKSAYALYDRGLAYEGLGLDDLAIEDLTAAIALDARDARRFERRGTIYFRKGQRDKALADYEQAINLDAQYAPALYGRGIIKRLNGDLAGGGADVASAKHFQDDVDVIMTNAGVTESARR